MLSRKKAVIDIGSNSCRLVIYDCAGAAVLPYFNDKTMAGLGRDMPRTGRLNEAGCKLALETLGRFRSIIRSMEVDEVRAVATAAVREAEDGPVFRQAAEAVLGEPIRLLSGAEEGYLSARGVMLGLPGRSRLVADLGGSSLELCDISGHACLETGETFLLGPLARSDDNAFGTGKRRKIMTKILQSSQLLSQNADCLTAVGGGWRTVALTHFMLTDYPFNISHGTQLTRDDLERIVTAMTQSANDDGLRDRLQKLTKKRFGSLLHATVLLDVLLEQLDLDEVTVSAYGLREGVIAGDDDVEPNAALFDSIRLYLKTSPTEKLFSTALYRFVKPIGNVKNIGERLLKAACMMADIGARMHPDHRPDLVFEQVLRAPLPMISHAQRVFLALALATRYTSGFSLPAGCGKVLSSSEQRKAVILGRALRLGGVYSGRAGNILERASLTIKSSRLTLTVPESDNTMVSETVRKRHRQLANALGCEAVLNCHAV